jgi:hypothetical protein
MALQAEARYFLSHYFSPYIVSRFAAFDLAFSQLHFHLYTSRYFFSFDYFSPPLSRSQPVAH